jgi:hypothetical protein
VLAKRLAQQEIAQCNPADLVGAILLAPVRLATAAIIRKGSRVDHSVAASLVAAARAGDLRQALRLAWPDPSELHEDTAAEQLATAAAGPGVEWRQPRQSRLDLLAKWNGVLHVETDRLIRFNTVDSIELFTLFHGQAVEAGWVIASVKVAPHLISAALVQAGIQVAREDGPLVEVRPYVPVDVAAIVTETVSGGDFERFQSGARMKVEALGSRFVGTTLIASPEIEAAEREIRIALESLILARRIPVVLVGGVSAGDPLSPFYSALDGLGGRVLRHGVPAHPGSMIWLAELGESRLLGLPQCGMFTLATAADLILPRLLTGERLTARELAQLAHGGVLSREMRFRFPAYAQSLEAPEG